MFKKEEYQWVIEKLDSSNDPSDWKQGLATLVFITTEPYGTDVKEKILVPYLAKALSHKNENIKKMAIRFIISFQIFDLLKETEHNIIAETFHDKYLKRKDKDAAFLKPLQTTFKKLKKEKKLLPFLNQVGLGKFDKKIIKELTFQLSYRDPKKMEEVLDLIIFFIKSFEIEKIDFIPVLEEFILDIDKRIYLAESKDIKEKLKNKARKIIGI